MKIFIITLSVKAKDWKPPMVHRSEPVNCGTSIQCNTAEKHTERATEHLDLIFNSVTGKLLSMFGTNYVCKSVSPNCTF